MLLKIKNVIRYSAALAAALTLILPINSAQAWTSTTVTASFFKAVDAESGALISSIQVDKSGNKYLAGSFAGRVDFDPTSGTDIRSSNGADDFFISKVNSKGNPVWVKTWGATDSDYANNIALDSSGNIFVAGDFGSSIDFDLGPGVNRLTAIGGSDYFLMKLNSYGDLIWVTQGGNDDYDTAQTLAVDSNGDVFFAGTFTTSTDINPSGSGTQNLFSLGQNDVFVAKYTSSGALVWGESFGSGEFDGVSTMALDSNGDLLLTGRVGDDTDFDPSPGGTNLVAFDEPHLIYVLRLNAAGEFVWVKTFKNEDGIGAYSIAVDSAGNTVLVGSFVGTVDLNPSADRSISNSLGQSDGFILKLDRAGEYVWSGSLGAADWDVIQNVQVDSSGNFYVLGQFLGDVNFDLDSGFVEKQSGEKPALFVAKYSPAGALAWVKTVVTTEFVEAWVLKIDSSRNLYVGAHFKDSVDIEPSSALGTFSSPGLISGLVIRFNSLGSVRVVTPTQKGVTTVSGLAKVSKILTANPGTWSANPRPTVTYQWYACSAKVTLVKTTAPRGCSKITGARSKTYTLKSAQLGKYVLVQVSASNGIKTISKFSKTTLKVAR